MVALGAAITIDAGNSCLDVSDETLPMFSSIPTFFFGGPREASLSGIAL